MKADKKAATDRHEAVSLMEPMLIGQSAPRLPARAAASSRSAATSHAHPTNLALASRHAPAPSPTRRCHRGPDLRKKGRC